VLPDGELLAAELASQILDGFIFAMCAKANQGVNAFIIEQVVIAKRVGTEVTLCGDSFLFSTRPLAHAPGNDMLSAQMASGLLPPAACAMQQGQSWSVLGLRMRGLDCEGWVGFPLDGFQNTSR